jgi:iron complex transport system ATP-binding protein
VSFGYGREEGLVLRDVSFDLAPASLVAVIGPNGAGKSTLLALASGTRRPRWGQVRLDGHDVVRLAPRERARRIATVPQSQPIPFAFTVREYVGLGRTPFLRPFRGESRADREAIERAMEQTDVARFAEYSILDLSGGERQRATLALALAQEADLLLLDEPTANLDLKYQTAFLDLIADLNRTAGLTVLVAIHDLNLAALYFERMIALGDGQILADGSPADVLTAETIRAVYGSSVAVIRHPAEGVPVVVSMRQGGTPHPGPPPEVGGSSDSLPLQGGGWGGGVP